MMYCDNIVQVMCRRLEELNYM